MNNINIENLYIGYRLFLIDGLNSPMRNKYYLFSRNIEIKMCSKMLFSTLLAVFATIIYAFQGSDPAVYKGVENGVKIIII